MPEQLIVIFLLFFAVLAFGWFYLQRAKARSSTTDTTATTSPSEPAQTAHTTDTTDDRAAS